MERDFTVLVPEVHYSHRIVKAENAEQAIEKAMKGEGKDIFVEYSHTLEDRKAWSVEE